MSKNLPFAIVRGRHIMLQKLIGIWYTHFHNNFILYVLTIAFFGFGIIFGALGLKALGVHEYQDLNDYFQSFISSLGQWEVSTISIAQRTIFNHLKTIFIVWFLGLTVIGIPIILIIMFVRGFVLGFTVGFIVQQRAAGGIIFAFLTVLPPNLFLVPVFIVAAVSALSFSLGLIKGRLKSGWGGISHFLVTYSALMLFLGLIAIVGALLEAYVTPVLMQVVVGYYL
ncbi:MAG: stage sporulation protein [Clostridia bacterium]|jgi:stage II sporulation protein M|nr:stage sporulation protein [Clostridia bacterium]